MARRTIGSRFYVAGHSPQYGADRWGRYERLRGSGFLKAEARDLSRIDHPDDLKIIDSMISQRVRLLRAFQRDNPDLTDNQFRYRYRVALRSWYRARGYDKKTNPVFAVYHDHENRLARKRGWKPGEYDPEHPDEVRVRRRTKGDTPPRKGGHNKGQVAAQKARAQAKKKAIRDRANKSGVPLKQLEMFLADSLKIPTNPNDEIQRAFRAQLVRRIEHAKAEARAGRPARA